MNLHFDDRDLVCEWESEDQPLPIQLPFRLILHVGYLHFDGYGTLQNGVFIMPGEPQANQKLCSALQWAHPSKRLLPL